ncbi:hypothetical protein B0H63DRAFT_457234 [Podospora didyma]|uniref:Nucleoporin NUP53 n=1 Tax=Podospora didyma TaxID=330526 RepID=A0AAE0P4X8_9PEZI|nr:hypothetical protein B0H63DRAFT_457234 [Podospora didyma]
MAPLILHNVPDDELYIGDDGVKRPYAMVFPHQDGASGRTRKPVVETGSFGKSTRRSRSKTGTPARREDPTVAAADKVFSNWINEQSRDAHALPQTTTGTGQQVSASQPGLGTQTLGDPNAPTQARFVKKQEPTEIILRGYRSTQQQYAAVNHYEELAGMICEDYSREPPIESRRYKSELREPAYTRRRALTAEERAKVNKADCGEHWVKVTFESAEAAEAAVASSPQSILGHLVYAEPYHGIPPARDEAIVDVPVVTEIPDVGRGRRRASSRAGGASSASAAFARAMMNPDSFDLIPPNANDRAAPASGGGSSTAFGRAMMNPDGFDWSPPRSEQSSRTADSTTVASGTGSSTTATSGTVTGRKGVAGDRSTPPPLQHTPPANPAATDEFCRAIPTVRKVKLLPMEDALLPAPSYTQRMLNHVPIFRWFSGSMIGNEVPRTDTGEFDWDKASLYWKMIWYLDSIFNLFGGEILNADKED